MKTKLAAFTDTINVIKQLLLQAVKALLWCFPLRVRIMGVDCELQLTQTQNKAKDRHFIQINVLQLYSTWLKKLNRIQNTACLLLVQKEVY